MDVTCPWGHQESEPTAQHVTDANIQAPFQVLQVSGLIAAALQDLTVTLSL